MRKISSVVALLIAFSTAALAQIAPPKPDWSSWNWIIGTWDGTGAGKPGTGTGSFSLLYSLDHAVLVRKSLSNYRAAKTTAKTHHEDFMVVYEENGHWRADYWDTERHVIHYGVTMGEGVATFLSDKTTGQPTFRLTYKRLDKGALSVEFAIATPGSDQFKPYVSGICQRRPGS